MCIFLHNLPHYVSVTLSPGVFLSTEIPLMVITALHTISNRWNLDFYFSLLASNFFLHFYIFFIFPQFLHLHGLHRCQEHCVGHQRSHLSVLPSQLCYILWHVQVCHLYQFGNPMVSLYYVLYMTYILLSGNSVIHSVVFSFHPALTGWYFHNQYFRFQPSSSV